MSMLWSERLSLNEMILFTDWRRSLAKSPRSKRCLPTQSGSIQRMSGHTPFGAMIYRSTKRTKQAAEAAQNAVRLNPNYAPAYAQLAQDQITPAELPQALADVDQAIKLSPRDPEMGRWHMVKGMTY